MMTNEQRAKRAATDRARYLRIKEDPVQREAWRINNLAQKRKQRATPSGRINKRVSDMIRRGLRGRKGGRKWTELLGYTVDDLVARLESTMTEGMTWGAVLSGDIHVDHIIPRSHFDQTDREQFLACWALDNLQFLWAEDNMRKSDKIDFEAA